MLFPRRQHMEGRWLGGFRNPNDVHWSAGSRYHRAGQYRYFGPIHGRREIHVYGGNLPRAEAL